ncbi:MAG: hypothetical protein U9R25_06290 [Chloroflexota bacterium]|nr:hypothetical protein [Chloroflexota bacterium]
MVAEKTLTRNEYYKLAHECRDYALRLANFDQNLVDRALCLEFNAFLKRVRRYDRLHQPLEGIRPARPITRRMVLSVVIIAWVLVILLGASIFGRFALLANSTIFTLVIALLVVPPPIYGTSVEAIEGRLFFVVQTMQTMLESGEMAFSEAAYFNVRDVLREASDELRQQVYLNRMSERTRPW